MHIEALRVRNFRRLKDVRIDMANDISIFVGSNNSGKTSASHAIDMFIGGARDRFSIHDFSVDTWQEFDKFEAEEGDVDLPIIGLDLWLAVKPIDLHRVMPLLPGLTFTGTTVGVRIEFAPVDQVATLTDYRQLRQSLLQDLNEGDRDPVYDPKPRTLREYLSTNLRREYDLRYFVLDRAQFNADYLPNDPTYVPSSLATENGGSGRELIRSLIKVDLLHAQRHLSDVAGGGRAEDLSRRLSKFYQRSLEQKVGDYNAMKALAEAEAMLNEHLGTVFGPTLDRLGQLGYPGVANPHLVIKSALDPELIMSNTDGTKVHWAVGSNENGIEPPTLPDQYNGLGYKNLIYMVVELLDIHAGWVSIEEKRPPLHLIFIEEPEAHLHAQLQQVFIDKVMDIVAVTGADAAIITSQVVVTTHSSHILYERGFQPIRYFRRGDSSSQVLNLSAYYNALPEPTNVFLAKYLKLTHCDLFFADAAVLVEGNVERLLLPAMIGKVAPRLKTTYLSILEIGGAYGHLFRSLIEFLGITALVITDVDSVLGRPPAHAVGNATVEAAVGAEGDAEEELDDDDETAPGTACMVDVLDAVTSNQTLVQWLPGRRRIDELLAADAIARTQARTPESPCLVHIVYQKQTSVTWRGETELRCGRTLEEAFALENLEWCQDVQRKALGLRVRGAAALEISALAEKIHKRVTKSLKKTDFALALLAQDDGWNVPSYIQDGLRWLEAETTPAVAVIAPALAQSGAAQAEAAE